MGSQVGRGFGQGLSSGLMEVLAREMEQRRRKERIQKQMQDLQSLQTVLAARQEGQDMPPGIGAPRQVSAGAGGSAGQGQGTLDYVLQNYEPQTKAGYNLMSQIMSRQFEKPESYTLGPGEVRYRGGQPVARGLRKRETEQVDAYKNGKKIPLRIPKENYNAYIQQLRKQGYSFDEPGQAQDQWSEPFQRGNQWLQKNKRTGKVRKAYDVAGAGGDMSAKEKEIQRYLDSGIAKTRQQAIKLAEGQYALGQDALGRSVLIDMTTGEEIRRVGDKGKGQQRQAELEPYASVEEIEAAFGPISGLKQLVNNVFGWAIPGQAFPGTERARNKVRILNQRLTPFLQVSERGAKWDMDRIDNILFTPQIFQDPDAAKDKVENLRSLIDTTIRNKQNILDSESLTAEQIKQFNNDISKLLTAKSLLPRPQEVVGRSGSGVTAQRIRKMDAESLQALDVDSLTDEQARIALERLEELEQGAR
jgi:hypothetical protein